MMVPTLKAYRNEKIKKVGVDPTIKKFSHFYPPEITQIADFFPCHQIDKYLNGKKCKVITSFSMFYDLEDPVAFAKVIAKYLDREGVWVFEQSYLPTMLDANSFDTICHEHLEFYALKQLDWILDAANLKIIDVELNDINGGSISVTAGHKNYDLSEVNLKRLNGLREEEIKQSIDTVNIWHNFTDRVIFERNRLKKLISDVKSKGGKVYGLGASTKGNVLLQYYGLTCSEITAIFDVNEEKFDCVTPGGKIPILNEAKLPELVTDQDILLVLPWHFKSFFIGLPQLKKYKLVFPLPVVNQKPL